MPEPTHEVDARYQLSEALDPKSLAALAADILKWSLRHSEVRILDGPGDGRRDILSRTPNGEQHLTQCKHHIDASKSVSSRETDEIVIAMAKFGVRSATFFTNGRISPQAKREYLDNFPQYSLDYVDGDLLLQFVEESPLLARIWLHGSTLGMTTHRLLVPFVIRNASDDSAIQPQASHGENHQTFWGPRELFEPYRPAVKTEGTSRLVAKAITGERRLSLTELPIAVADMKQEMLRGLNPDKAVWIVRFGKPALSNPQSENNDDRIWVGGIEPESYVISGKGQISTEKDWLLPELDSGWQFPINISVLEVEWSGWFSEERDAFLMYDINWPYVAGSHQFADISAHAEREAVSQSLFVAVSDREVLSHLQGFTPHWTERLGETFVLGWLHPYLRPEETGQHGTIRSEGGQHIPLHPDAAEFAVEVARIRGTLKKLDLEEFEAERAIHLAAAAARPLVNFESHDRAPAAQIREYFEDIPSPVYFLDRTMSFLQMWELDDESALGDAISIDALQSQLPDGLAIHIDVKRGRRTGNLFAMVTASIASVGPESATQHATRLIDIVTDLKPSIKDIVESTWRDAVLATKRFWRDEVGMFFEDGKVIGRPWVMFTPPDDAPDQEPRLYIIRPDEVGDSKFTKNQ